MHIVSIFRDSKYKKRNYELKKGSSKAICIDTSNLLKQASKKCIVYLHANDIRWESQLLKQIITKGKDYSWQFCLFTNDDSPGKPIHEFGPASTVYPWKDIESSFPNVPQADHGRKAHLIVFFHLCQGYLAAHGGVGLESWKEVRNEKYREISQGRKDITESVEKWWKPIKTSPSIEQELLELGMKIKLVDNLRGVSGIPLTRVTDTSMVEESYKTLCKPENFGRFL